MISASYAATSLINAPGWEYHLKIHSICYKTITWLQKTLNIVYESYKPLTVFWLWVFEIKHFKKYNLSTGISFLESDNVIQIT